MTEEEANMINEEISKIENAEAPTEEELETKEKMLQEGFSNWSKRDFVNFVKVNEKYGRDNVEKIYLNVPNKTEEEVKEYYKIFWTRNNELTDSAKYVSQIEKGEAKLNRHKVLLEALEAKYKSYTFPEWQLKMNNVAQKMKHYSEAEDRFMIVQLYKLNGLEQPQTFYFQLQDAFRKSAEFRFDWFIKSRTQYELEKRVNTLLNCLEKEYLENKSKARLQKSNSDLNMKDNSSSVTA
ncbi:MAG: regulator of chromatin, subfamily a, member [Paramarteilia canceri]